MSRSFNLVVTYNNYQKRSVFGLYNPKNSELEISQIGINTDNVNHCSKLLQEFKNKKLGYKYLTLILSCSDRQGLSCSKVIKYNSLDNVPTISEIIEMTNNLAVK